MTKKIHSKIENSELKKQFPSLEDLMKDKTVRKNSKKKKNFKKKNDFYNQVKENRENNGEDIS